MRIEGIALTDKGIKAASAARPSLLNNQEIQMHTLVKRLYSNLSKASFALLLVACSSGSEAGSSGSAAQISSYDFCNQLAGAVCDGADLCCSKPQLSHTACATEVAESCSNDLLWNVKKEDYDPARAAAVVADIRKAGQACAFFTLPKTSSITKVLSPRLGEPCGVEFPYKDSVVCPEAAFCGYNAAANANICTKRGQQGEACDGDHTPCAKDFNCIAGSGQDAQCVRRLKQGESCTGQYDGYQVCIEGLECVAVSTTEAECQPVRDKGGKCASYRDCASQLCYGADAQALGTCATCSTNSDCGETGYCVKGACAISVPLKDGEACGADENCESGKCYEGQCGLPTADDAFCIAKGSVNF